MSSNVNFPPSTQQLQHAANDLTGDNVFGFGVNLNQSQLKKFAETGVNPVTGQQVHGQDLDDVKVLASASNKQFNSMASDNGGGTIGDWSTATYGAEGGNVPSNERIQTSYGDGHMNGGNEGMSSPWDGATEGRHRHHAGNGEHTEMHELEMMMSQLGQMGGQFPGMQQGQQSGKPSTHQLQSAANDLTGDNVFGFGVNLNQSQLKQFASTGVNPVTGQQVHGQDLQDIRVLASASNSQFNKMASDNGGGTVGDWSTATFGAEGGNVPAGQRIQTSYGNGHFDGGNEGMSSPRDGATSHTSQSGGEGSMEMLELEMMMQLSQSETQPQDRESTM